MVERSGKGGGEVEEQIENVYARIDFCLQGYSYLFLDISEFGSIEAREGYC